MKFKVNDAKAVCPEHYPSLLPFQQTQGTLCQSVKTRSLSTLVIILRMVSLLPLRPRPVAFALALDQTLNSPLHAVPSVSGIPLPLGLGVDHRMSSFKSSVSVL